MAEASSPLSSPPSSIIDVALGSPAASPSKQQPFTGSYLEMASDITEIIKSDIAEVPKPGPTTATNGHGEESPTTPGSDGDGQSSAQKRKASVPKKSTPTKKPRRALPVIKRSAKDKKWDAPQVYTDSRSPLAHADLRVRISHLLVLWITFLTLYHRQFYCSQEHGIFWPRRRRKTYSPNSPTRRTSRMPAPQTPVPTRSRSATTTTSDTTARATARISSLAGMMRSGCIRPGSHTRSTGGVILMNSCGRNSRRIGGFSCQMRLSPRAASRIVSQRPQQISRRRKARGSGPSRPRRQRTKIHRPRSAVPGGRLLPRRSLMPPRRRTTTIQQNKVTPLQETFSHPLKLSTH